MSEEQTPEVQVPEAPKVRAQLQTGEFPDPWKTPIDALDVSDSRLYQQDAWRPYFERLRAEDPVHYTSASPFGPYWSITTHRHIMEVEGHPEVFSSFPTISPTHLRSDGTRGPDAFGVSSTEASTGFGSTSWDAPSTVPSAGAT